MPPKRALRKWVGRDYGKRLGSLRNSTATYRSVFEVDSIFRAAELLVKHGKQNKGMFIFIGQGMRPLFESVRAVNEKERAISRKRLKYVVTPKSTRVFSAENIETVKQKLLERKIVTTKQNTYFLVDVSFDGYTKRVITQAIREINPNATVIDMEKEKGIIGEGIRVADGKIPVPTNKNWATGNVSRGDGSSYLEFQQALQDYLKTRKKATNK